MSDEISLLKKLTDPEMWKRLITPSKWFPKKNPTPVSIPVPMSVPTRAPLSTYMQDRQKRTRNGGSNQVWHNPTPVSMPLPTHDRRPDPMQNDRMPDVHISEVWRVPIPDPLNHRAAPLLDHRPVSMPDHMPENAKKLITR